MRIVQFIRALIAVLGLAAVFHPVFSNEYFNDTLNEFSYRRSPRRPRNIQGSPRHIMYRTLRKNQKLLEEDSNRTVDCCPTVQELVEPTGGKNQDGIYVELYRDHNYKQRFYELSCRKDILNEPCKFINKKQHSQSRCVQKYSYTYALVKDTPSHRNKNFPMFPAQGSEGVTYTLDYISVRSGCSCVVINSKKKRNKKRQHGSKT